MTVRKSMVQVLVGACAVVTLVGAGIACAGIAYADGISSRGTDTAVAAVPDPDGDPATDISTGSYHSFSVFLRDGEQAELARRGPLRYIARCDLQARSDAGDGSILTRRVDRVDILITSTVDAYSPSERAPRLPAGTERTVFTVQGQLFDEHFETVGGNAVYAETNGKRHYLSLAGDIAVGLNLYPGPDARGCTVMGGAFRGTGQP